MEDSNKTKEQLTSEQRLLLDTLGKLKMESRHADALFDIVQTVARIEGLQDMLNEALNRTISAMDADMGLIYLLDMSEKSLSLKVHKGLSQETVSRISTVKYSREEFRKVPGWKLKDMSISQLFGEATLTSIASGMKEERPQSLASIALSGALSGKEELNGVIVVASRKQRCFSQEDMRLLATIGYQVGIIIENRMLVADLRRLSTVDSIAGLHNQRYFEQRLQEEVSRSSRYRLQFSLLLLRMDEFEACTIRLGQKAGNKIIATLGQLIQETIRNTDIGCCCDENEFAIIMPHTDCNGAQIVAKRLRQRARDVFALQSLFSRFHLTLSLGVASFPTDASTPGRLIELARAALANAIRHGGNQVRLASDVAHGISMANHSIANIFKNLGELTLTNIFAIAFTVDTKNHGAHSQMVSRQANAIGEVLGLSDTQMRRLRIGALLHDIGKIQFPDSMLGSSVSSSEKELTALQQHPDLGAEILKRIPDLEHCASAVRHHHEHYDGSGYPSGLKDNQIPIEARVIAVADAYVNMTAPSSAHRVLSNEEAIQELTRYANTQFDPTVVWALVKLVASSLPSITGENLKPQQPIPAQNPQY
jgi:diguanylate cyclase (GGDEF)-like protein/putative nucleotidyltransferase with HDIG domain